MLVVIGWFWKSRTGAILTAFAAVGLALFTWHTFDKSSAVRAVVSSFVADVELAAAEAELAVLKRRTAALETANFSFQQQLTESEALRTQQALELDDYVSTVDAVVDRPLFERLSNR
ncbi:hypothetical protein [Labrenzia sp. OB1]|uniref:hypothetical protein n=1 Tax=Labrenzia sp. OB1 TaxID=1561204 RepID=UPI0007B2EA0E|nr:hypothetical protein [Labrenzia sp. OB1]KZM49055.1 hypothetical protein OA90_16410 [Labrenzia sp. OB1]